MKVKTVCRRLLFGLLVIALPVLLVVGPWWLLTQPIWWFRNRTVDTHRWKHIPPTNQKLLVWVDCSGDEIAPSYQEVVCTEFVINAVQRITPLTNREKNDIRVITPGNLAQQVAAELPVIKGVQTALARSNKGMAIAPAHVHPGDLVQFWTLYCGKAFGHCGIVLDIDPGKTLTLYSSHPLTGGFGKQVYLWPDYAYFVRLSGS